MLSGDRVLPRRRTFQLPGHASVAAGRSRHPIPPLHSKSGSTNSCCNLVPTPVGADKQYAVTSGHRLEMAFASEVIKVVKEVFGLIALAGSLFSLVQAFFFGQILPAHRHSS